MFFAACGCAAAVIVAFYIGIVWTSVIAAFYAVKTLALVKQERKRLIAAVLLVSYGFGLISFWHTDHVLTKESLKLTENFIRGEITDCEERTTQSGDSYLQMTVKTEQGKVLCKGYNNCFIEGMPAEGCRAEFNGRMKDPSGKRNPGCFDYALYLRSQGIVKVMTCSRITVDPVRPFS